ncbi:sulfhydryl oxidase 1-like [Scaptodrosophila lebanonensis]|uniref:Sulfhydryl oxidase n=1 Tax=Drosophila lebanonensis TaxID=7225 RepID=A0A6J2T473_DROLE|nr:sulfhydryl oxidase 1-like [Scaptodrosophila lebanonensis]
MPRPFLLATLATWLFLCLVQTSSAEKVYPSLYTVNDRVSMENATTFESKLNSPTTLANPALVQFINSFCGDCRRFATTFKKVALQLYEWRSALQVLVVDCAQEINVKLCRQYNITSVPTLYFMDLKYGNKKIIPIMKRDVDGIRNAVAELLSSYVSFTRPLTLLEAEQRRNYDFDYAAVIYQPPGSFIGRDTLLDLLSWPVDVRIVDNSAVAKKFDIDTENTKISIIDKKSGIKLPLKVARDTREAYVNAIASVLRMLSFNPEPTPPTIVLPSNELDDVDRRILETVTNGKATVYRADLEQAIDMILHIEIPRAGSIREESLQALRNLLDVLRKLNPLNKPGKQLLNRLYDYVKNVKHSLSGEDFQNELRLQERKLPKIFKAQRFVGCIASRPNLRGFTCSLWTLFHYLTVQTADDNTIEPGFILEAIHGFVKNFFGCTDCVNHFLEMARRRQIWLVKNKDEEVLWLWRAHNEVNKRLAGDSTEDPKFLKLQYPSAKDCPGCSINIISDTQWNEPKVFSFLKDVYHKKNLNNYALPTIIGYD